MDNIYRAASEYRKLNGFEYKIIVGYKGKATEILLRFDIHNFYHLCGLHKLTDIFRSNENRIEFFNNILGNRISDNDLAKSKFYLKERVDDRIKRVANLSSLLDNGISEIYKYNNNANSRSKIKGDFLIKSITPDNNTVYFVLKKDLMLPDKHFGITIFSRSKSEEDFTLGHTRNTLLYVSKTPLINNKELDKDKEIVLYQSHLYTQSTNPNIHIVKFAALSEKVGADGVLVSPRVSVGQAFKQTLSSFFGKIKQFFTDKTTSSKQLNKDLTSVNANDEQLAETKKSGKEPVMASTKPTKSFSQGLDDFTKRVNAQNAQKPTVHNTFDRNSTNPKR